MRTCPQCRRRYADGEAFCPYDGARLRDGPRDPTRQPDLDDPLVGIRLDGRYELQRVLGKGGMGTVYAGRQLAIQKPVAIKVLRAVDDDGQAMGRFEREARSASKLGHAHIVDIFDFGRTPSPLGGPDALAYLVMELLDGEDLGARLERGPLTLDRALTIIIQCCSALGAAHAAGIVHRDLKPENIFLITDPATGSPDFAKVVDFGLAKITETEMEGEPGRKLTQTGMVFGTPHYMPPEQCTGQPTDPRADVYSLGIILFEALTGRPPFDGNTFMSVINQHLLDPPPPLADLHPTVDVPPGIEAAIRHAMGKMAADRPASMKAFADELLAAVVGTKWAYLAEQLRQSVVVPGSSSVPVQPHEISPDAFAQTPAVHAVVDLDAASLARGSQTPILLENPKPPAEPSAPRQLHPPAEPSAPRQLHPPAEPSGSRQLHPPAEPSGSRQLIPATRRAIDPVPPVAPEADSAARPRFSAPSSTPPPRAPALHPSSTPAPRAHPSSEAPAPPVNAGTRALGWVLGAVILLLLGGALGYGALLLAR